MPVADIEIVEITVEVEECAQTLGPHAQKHRVLQARLHRHLVEQVVGKVDGAVGLDPAALSDQHSLAVEDTLLELRRQPN